MTVNDILAKIDGLNETRNLLKDIIYHHRSEISTSGLLAIFDAHDAIGEYIEELKKREVKE